MLDAQIISTRSETVVPASTAKALLACEMPKTMFRLAIATIALASCLVVVTGDAGARQDPNEELAYGTRLYGLIWRYHANDQHHDGSWAQAALAQSDCNHGKLAAGTEQLEYMLRDHDLFAIPANRTPTYTGFAYP